MWGVTSTSCRGRKARDGVFMSQVEPESAKRQAEQRNASPDRALGTPHLRSMLSTAELARRPSRPPDYAAENRALIVLAQVMATSPESVLQRLADTALALCRADSARLSLLEESDQRSTRSYNSARGRNRPRCR